MANESRLLGKQVIKVEGIEAALSGATILEESGAWTLGGGARVGESGTKLAQVSSTLATIDFGAIQPVGSGAAVGVDVALAGVAPGDLCLASPTASISLQVFWAAACYSAGVVNVRATQVYSGNLDPGATPFRVMAIKF